MNYKTHYSRLIERARARVLTGYRERHHVVPRCIGGGDDPTNLVELTAEEHYVAHQLLVRIHPGQTSLWHAAVLMSSRGARRGNRAYGWLVRGLRGRPKSAEQRANIAAAKLGVKRAPFSAQWRQRMGASKRGRPLSSEHRAKIAAALTGKKNALGYRCTEEQSARKSKALLGNQRFLGRSHSAETKAKMAAARSAYWERRAS